LPTGFAEQDTGKTRIQIADLLAIDVDDNNALIDFGNCTPPQVVGTEASISSFFTEAQINNTNMTKCVSPNTPANITIWNTGNVYANVTVNTDKTAQDLLVSTRAEIFYLTQNSTTNGGCAAADTQASWTEMALTGTAANYSICKNLTFGEFTSRVEFYINLTVPNDARTPGTGPNVTLTFMGRNT